MAKTNKSEHPLILVFYLDRELFKRNEIVKPFIEAINKIIEIKKMNAISFFMPTDKEERVECINPAVISSNEMDKVMKIVNDINKHFGVGEDNLDHLDEDITID